MVIVMKSSAGETEISAVIGFMDDIGIEVEKIRGNGCILLSLTGDTFELNRDKIRLMDGVEKVISINEPYKLVSRKFHPEDTVIRAGNVAVGGKKLCVIAGPCSVESKEQILDIANSVKEAGASILRGGTYKLRTSPYAFQGLKMEGLSLLKNAGEKINIPVISEIVSPKHLEDYIEKTDIIQIGARNMQNFDLLKEVGKTEKPVLLKRGFSATVEEWLMSAEYILNGGNPNVILCERGIRTFETYTRNTLDLSAVCAVKRLCHLPVVVDPSHASGLSWMVPSLSMAAVAAGADGLIIEVHNNPQNALSDGVQALSTEKFSELIKQLKALAQLMGREL